MNGYSHTQALVSVVITTYNHAGYLPDAVGSVLSQTYARIELIVVDDGSTDNTSALMQAYPTAQYIRQENQGLAVARNTGLHQATGKWICFLDADDALLPNSIANQIKHVAGNETVGFISGGHILADENLQHRKEVAANVYTHHFEELLQRNYIGMHAAVLYRTEILKQHPFDPSFAGCEDYDVYLRISRHHPIVTHTQPIAVYRTLPLSMSGNLPMMLDQSHKALRKQQPFLKTKEQTTAYRKGLNNWTNHYGYAMASQLLQERLPDEKKRIYLRTLLKCKPKLYIRHYIYKLTRLSKSS